MKLCYLMIGIPGSGKSTWIRKTISDNPPFYRNPDYYILSTDTYWYVHGRGYYHFNPKLLGEAHEWNYQRFLKAIDGDNRVVFVDNTNLDKSHILKYAGVADQLGYEVCPVFMELKNIGVYEIFKRQKHGVPYIQLYRLKQKFDNLFKSFLNFISQTGLNTKEFLRWLNENPK